MTNFGIIALDPGGTTGWATFTAEKMLDTNGNAEYFDRKFNCGQLGPGFHHASLFALLELNEVETYHVITESFEYRNRSRPGLELISVQYIGIAELFCQRNNRKLISQTAAQGKIHTNSLVKKENLQKLDLWVNSYVHAMDAMSHMLYYMINTADILRLELLREGWK